MQYKRLRPMMSLILVTLALFAIIPAMGQAASAQQVVTVYKTPT